ncbi:MAG: response regulator [Chitinophagales bacterium]
MSSNEALYQRRFQREKMARQEAERILEEKSLELYQVNKQLKELNDNLEEGILKRTQDLQTSELRLSTLISNLHSGILLEDEDRRVVVTNGFFCKTFHIDAPPEALIGMDCRGSAEMSKHLFVDPEGFINRVNELLESRKICVEERLFMKDGLVLERDYIPIFEKDRYLGHLWQYRDVTLRNIELLEIEQAKRMAEQMQKAEKQFLASMSHEIRTPLNAVIGMANLLYDTRPTKEQIEFLDIIQTSANILQALISDILDLSKIEAGKIEYNENPIDLVGLIRALQKTFQIKLNSKNIEVESFVDTAIENYILSDQMLINQILLNLLGNAEKFTESGSIGLQVKLMEKDGEDMLLKFKVYDTGIGIEKNRLGAIFEKFKQANNEVRVKYGGTGLGLPITKKLIEFLGGKITVESEVGRGTTFTFTLPVKDAGFKDEKKSKKVIDNFELDKLYILVVEDNKMNRKYLDGLFKRWNVRHEMAVNGKHAMEWVDKQQFDLILMDIQMPVMDGYQATIAIRNSHNLNKNTPIIALTASALLDQREKALSLGMNGHITKPFTPTQLLEGIKTYAQTSNNKEGIEANVFTIEEDVALVEKNKAVEIEAYNPDSEFVFVGELDKDYLHEFYEGDLDYMIDMFESFFESTVSEVPHLKKYTEAKNWEDLSKLAHKIAPTFSIVGLTSFEPKFREVEKMVARGSTGQELLELMDEIEAALPEKITLIASELNRMKEYQS